MSLEPAGSWQCEGRVTEDSEVARKWVGQRVVIPGSVAVPALEKRKRIVECAQKM